MLHPYPVSYRTNLSQDALRELSLAHTPAISKTAVGNLCKVARNKARKAAFTFIISQDPASGFSHKLISPAEAQPLIDAQQAYIQAKGELLELQAYVGLGPRAVPVQWLYTVEGANICAMQSILSFPRQEVERPEELAAPFAPTFRVEGRRVIRITGENVTFPDAGVCDRAKALDQRGDLYSHGRPRGPIVALGGSRDGDLLGALEDLACLGERVVGSRVKTQRPGDVALVLALIRDQTLQLEGAGDLGWSVAGTGELQARDGLGLGLADLTVQAACRSSEQPTHRALCGPVDVHRTACIRVSKSSELVRRTFAAAW